jgi:hypothetical protein
MAAEALLSEISDFCKVTVMAESTFGRRAVNDGKFVARLRYGGRVTTTTVERVRAFIEGHVVGNEAAPVGADHRVADPAAETAVAQVESLAPSLNFRFFDNRQKYLLFVSTCSEKAVVSERIAKELDNLSPRPPAIRLFDAGVGDGSVLARVLRSMHRRYEKFPFYAVGKEISLADVRVALEKMPDRFVEHPATCLVTTNLSYAEAPWLTPSLPLAAQTLIWKEVSLQGQTAGEFEEQIAKLKSRTGSTPFDFISAAATTQSRCGRAPAPSVTLTASTKSLSGRTLSSKSFGSAERGGVTSAVMTNRCASSADRKRVAMQQSHIRLKLAATAVLMCWFRHIFSISTGAI